MKRCSGLLVGVVVGYIGGRLILEHPSVLPWLALLPFLPP